MDTESHNPFNFEIPEKKTTSIWLKILTVFLIGIFVIIPLAEIDNRVFDYNEVFISLSHQNCSCLKCVLTSCQ